MDSASREHRIGEISGYDGRRGDSLTEKGKLRVRYLPLMFARLLLAAWVGAAVLFVVTGVREVTTKNPFLNNSPVKDSLVVVRFPAYYAAGFAAVGGAILGTLLCAGGVLPRWRKWAVVGLLVVAMGAMVADYFWVYQPLLEMVTPPGKSKPASFVDLHEASKRINTVDVGLCLLAAMIISWPISTATGSDS